MTKYITVKLTGDQVQSLIELINDEEMNRLEFSTPQRAGFLFRLRDGLKESLAQAKSKVTS